MENRKLNKYEDAVAIYFKLDYDDVELYSSTIEDAHRTPAAEIITKDKLDEFLKDLKWKKTFKKE